MFLIAQFLIILYNVEQGEKWSEVAPEGLKGKTEFPELEILIGGCQDEFLNQD
jgi:hypothetical protein